MKMHDLMTLFSVLSLGGFIPTNDLEIAIEAFADFYHQVTNKHQRCLHFTVIDKSGEAARFKALAKELEIKEVFTVVGCDQQEVLEDYYANSATVILPTKEKLGMLIPEALSFGVPVLSFDFDSTKEHIDNSCGMLVRYQSREQSIQDFSRCLKILYFDPEALKILKRGAYKKYENNFTWKSKRSIRIGAR